MAYYEESIHLDLSKEIYSVVYTSLVPEEELEGYKEEGEDLKDAKVDFSTNAYLFFKEKAIIRRDVVNLCKYVEVVYLQTDQISPVVEAFPFDKLTTRINQILQKYHEQPALLDKTAKFIVEHVMAIVKQVCHRFMESHCFALKNDTEAPPFPTHTSELLKILNILTSIRGQDRITRHFPHEPQDFEPLIFTLISQLDSKVFPWEANFVLLTWLSLILLMPFDLMILDSKAANIFAERLGLAASGEGSGPNIVDAIVSLCQHFLHSTTVSAGAAAECLGKLFSRKDIKETPRMTDFVEWALREVQEHHDNQMQFFFVDGLYTALDNIFKTLSREELLPVISKVFDALFKHEQKALAYSVGTVRHSRTRLAQRMALCILRPKHCSWMHRRTKRSLLDNFRGTLDLTLVQTNVALLGQIRAGPQQATEAAEDSGIDEDVDLDILEALISQMFDSLKDKDTVIRWTAAEAIGRITQRLDLELANDIVNEIVDTFLHAGESEWHGGLMALGELARRGLLLPENLSRVVHILKRGLIFEVAQGTYTTGSNVRDAACYVAWAFSRAFEPEVMQPYVHDLAASLLLCALYDKEPACRRAAAAAFQENVGRQGNFPRGIEIITEADYFSLGVRQNSYLLVSIFVAHYKEYYRYFVEHLATVKLLHCDVEIRKLAAATLCLLACMDAPFMIEQILPKLVSQTTSSNFYVRHGAILGLGQILVGLAGHSQEHCLKDAMKDSIFLKTMTVNERKLINPGEYMRKFQQEFEVMRLTNHIEQLPADLKKSILKVVGDIEAKRLYRGKGGDQMRVVVSRLICDISVARLKITRPIHNLYMDTIDENLRHSLEVVVKEAELALLKFSEVYHKKASDESSPYVKKFLEKSLSDPIITTRRGYTMAISALSPSILAENLDEVISVFEKNSEIVKKKQDDDPELRNFAAKGFQRLITRLEIHNLTEVRVKKILDRLVYVMDDYSVDRRGDIGSMVRETGMYSLLDLIKVFCSSTSAEDRPAASFNPVTSEAATLIIGLLLQQLVERIDKMRLIAGSILQTIFDKYFSTLPDFAHKEELLTVFGNKYLRERVKRDQDKIDTKFDVSLVDTSFLDYSENTELVYFWDMPQCVFPLIVPLMRHEAYSYYILRGLCLSLGGITASTSDGSLKAVDEYMNSYEGDRQAFAHSTLDNFFKLLDRYKRIERFITPIFNTLAFFYKSSDFFEGPTFREKHLKLAQIMHDELISTKFSGKLAAGCELLCSCITAVFSTSTAAPSDNLSLLKDSKMLALMSHLLNHE
jgi:hypothetical protein